MREIIHEHVRAWVMDGVRDIAVGCSGNFTIERTLAHFGAPLHSNDVQLYSCALGWLFSGQNVPITLKAELRDELGWLDEYLTTDTARTATVMIGSQDGFLNAVGKPGSFHRRMFGAFKAQFPDLHAKTAEKLRALTDTLPVASYHAKDVVDWLADDVDDDWPVITFPPFFAGDYTSQFKALDDTFEWPSPSFVEMDDDAKDRLLEQITSRDRWLIGLHEARDHLAPQLRGVVRTANRGVPIYLYASGGPTRIVMPRQETEPVDVPRITEDVRLDGSERVALAPITDGQFMTLRSQYMNVNIVPGVPDARYGATSMALLIDGALAGAFLVGDLVGSNGIAYGLTDFPVSSSAYPRLSKLIVMAMLSHEARLLAQQKRRRRYTRLMTTAFSNKPVSMKYGRGVQVGPHKMTMANRSELDDDDPEHVGYRWRMNYIAPFGKWTLQEAYDAWLAKHSKVAA